MLPSAVVPAIEAAAPVTRRFAEAGHRLYLVGGIVRDLLAGRPVRRQDLDLTTDAEPATVKQLVSPIATSVWTQGERFGTIGCIVEGQDLEITTHRAESYSGATRKPTVAFSDDVVADLSRRDFTVNAIAIEVTSPEPRLIDPFDGAGDLAAGVLRTPLDPAVSFSDDPLRMLRAARFVASFSLSPVPELVDAVIDMRERLSIVSTERIRDELEKLLRVAAPEAGLEFLERTGLLALVLADLSSRSLEPDALGCHADALRHTFAAVAAAPPGGAARRAALLGPALGPALGSVGTGTNGSGIEGTPEDEGSESRPALEARLRDLRFSNDAVAEVVAVTGAYDTLRDALADPRPSPGADNPDASAAALRRLVLASGGRADTVLGVARAEAAARRGVDDGELARRVDGLGHRLAELARNEDLDDLEPAVDGDAVMARLGLRPGPDVGAALAHLRRRRIDLGPRDAAVELDDVEGWWTERHAATTAAPSDEADRSGRDVP